VLSVRYWVFSFSNLSAQPHLGCSDPKPSPVRNPQSVGQTADHLFGHCRVGGDGQLSYDTVIRAAKADSGRSPIVWRSILKAVWQANVEAGKRNEGHRQQPKERLMVVTLRLVGLPGWPSGAAVPRRRFLLKSIKGTN
jgi:hypothetical protein